VVAARVSVGDHYSDVAYEEFSIDIPPILSITTPAEGQVCKGSITVTGQAWDDVGVETVEVRIDEGDWLATEGLENWSHELDTTLLSWGCHTLEARGFDGARRSDPVRVGFSVDQPPGIEIIIPSEDDEYSGEVVLQGEASDDREVIQVEVNIDNAGWLTAVGTTEWEHMLDLSDLDEGVHNLSVKSFDGHQYSEIANTTFIVKHDRGSEGIPAWESVPVLISLLVIALLMASSRRGRTVRPHY
jgi:hypothetical protein